MKVISQKIKKDQKLILKEEKLFLKDVTLVCVDCVDLDRVVFAIEQCRKNINFEKILLLTSIENNLPYSRKIEKICNRGQYSEFCLHKLADHIDTKHCLLVQYDGFIINSNLWDNNWLQYDYIGSPFLFNANLVGNGGFSLRSKKLLDMCKVLYNKTPTNHCEDLVICSRWRKTLESNNIKFSPPQSAKKFSTHYKNKMHESFGFHNKDYAVEIRINHNKNKLVPCEIRKVLYGVGNKLIDSISILKGKIEKDNYIVYNKNKDMDALITDPVPGKRKDIIIEYNINGKLYIKTIPSGLCVDLLSVN